MCHAIFANKNIKRGSNTLKSNSYVICPDWLWRKKLGAENLMVKHLYCKIIHFIFKAKYVFETVVCWLCQVLSMRNTGNKFVLETEMKKIKFYLWWHLLASLLVTYFMGIRLCSVFRQTLTDHYHIRGKIKLYTTVNYPLVKCKSCHTLSVQQITVCADRQQAMTHDNDITLSRGAGRES